MSRSGYSYECDDYWATIRWRGAVKSAIRGKRGQAFLRELLSALDAMPEKRLIGEFLEIGPNVCAIGAVGRARGVDMDLLDPEDREGIASAFGIAEALAAEIMYENDEATDRAETPEERFLRVRAWVAGKIR